LLREPISEHRDFAYFKGCGAGLNTIAIEVEGKIKGCPSLPSAEYTNGNIRERSWRDIYENSKELRFNDIQKPEDATAHLWGECAGCENACCRPAF
jgi:radical SAM protein with 4Fe4S-binding SPASM domain